MQTLFISVSKIKEISNIQSNVDTKVISNTIYDIQSLYILPVLGDNLYSEFIIQLSGNTVSPANQYLLDNYIYSAIKHYVTSELIYLNHIKITNAGTQTLQPDNTNQPDNNTLYSSKNHYKNMAETYINRLKEYLCKYSKNYPLFNSPNNEFYQGTTQKKYETNIYFPKRFNR